MENDYKVSLEAARVNAKLTQEEARKAIGISKVTLIKYEKGITAPTIPTLKRMCEIYNVPLSRISICG